MRLLKSAVLFAAAMTGVAGIAHAGAGIVTTTVSPVSLNVTYRSSTLATFVAYTVNVGSDPTNTNTINNVLFTGTVSATDGQEQFAYDSVEVLDGLTSLTCSSTSTPPPAASVTISCPIGQLRAGQQFPTFVVYFKAPAFVVNGGGDPPAPDFANFSGTTYYAEQTGGIPQSPPQNSAATWTASQVTLGTTNPTLVKSALPKSGGSFFTGTNATPNPSYPIATAATVNSLAAPLQIPTITIEQNPLFDNCQSLVSSGQILSCQISAITIPNLSYSSDGTAGWLSIKLRLDASQIVTNPFKIDQVRLYYKDSTGNTSRIDNVLCPRFGTTSAGPILYPNGEQPCIANRVYYKNKAVPGWTSDLDGDAEWTIYVLKNGSYKVF